MHLEILSGRREFIGGTWYDHGYSILVWWLGNVRSGQSVLLPKVVQGTLIQGRHFFLTADWEDIFILKLDNNGNFIWAKDIGNVLESRGCSVALDAAGNVYTTGYF